MSTTYDSIQYEHGGYSPTAWSAKHDLIHNLVPFKHFTANPWGQLKTLTDFLRGLPEHASTWRFRDLPDLSSRLNHSQRVQALTDVIGAWPITKEATLGTLWVNPFYSDLDQVEWTPDEPKIQHWLRCAMLGRWTMRELAGRYNNYVNALQDIFTARAFRFGEVQAYGRRRLANTVLLTREWTGQSVSEAARRIGIPGRTLRQWVNRYATLDPVPERPYGRLFD
jgi:hypothetical protein